MEQLETKNRVYLILAILGLILGILSFGLFSSLDWFVITVWWVPIPLLALSIIGIIISGIAIKDYRAMGIIGLVLGIIGLVPQGIAFLFFILFEGTGI